VTLLDHHESGVGHHSGVVFENPAPISRHDERHHRPRPTYTD
jgi:hypothetical protein